METDDLQQAIRFMVRGTPRALPRARYIKPGHVVSITEPKARAYRAALERAARRVVEALEGQDWHRGAVRVEIVAVFPAEDPHRWGKPHEWRPDADNVTKMILDAMQAAKLLPKGDERAAEIACRKLWGEVGTTIVTMSPVKGDPVPEPGAPTQGGGWLEAAQQSADS